MHLATRGNNTILRTPTPRISSSEEKSPRLTRHTLAQHRTTKSSVLKSYLHKVNVKSYPSPLFPLCNTHIHNTSSRQLRPHTHHIVTPGFLEAGWWTTSRKIGLPPPPTSKGHGSR